MPADADVLASWIDETKTRMSSISLMGSIVAVLGQPNIMDQTKPQSQDLLWHFHQCGKDPNLDRYNRLPQTCHSQRTLSFGAEPFKIITLFGG